MAIRADRVGVRQDQVDIHGRVTSPSFLNELLENLPEWTDMPVWVNGTEEVLPSNTSVPVTSPILADIAYPDIRRDNQYFTYRESPTPVDGLAKIKSIKGKTLKWNQLFNISNPAKGANTSNYQVNGSSFSFRTTSANDNYVGNIRLTQNHIYYVCATNKSSSNLRLDRYIPYSALTQLNANSSYAGIVDIGSSRGIIIFSNSADVDITIENFIIIDLSLMYGIGNEPATVEEFTSLFPLPYYAYNAGTLLSFNGTGIKTTGKNLINADESYTFNPTLTPIPVYLEANKAYTVSYEVNVAGLSLDTQLRTADNSRTIVHIPRDTVIGQRMSVTMTPTEPVYGLRFYVNGQITVSNIQIEFGSVATDYEPYTTTTTDLPISTYFPTGMKSAGTVHDELTPTKGITRIGAVDMGTMTWRYITGDNARFESTSLTDVIKKLPNDNTIANMLCSAYSKVGTLNNVYFHSYDPCIAESQGGNIGVYDSRFTDLNSFTSAMQGVYLYYELATPVELPTMSFE